MREREGDREIQTVHLDVHGFQSHTEQLFYIDECAGVYFLFLRGWSIPTTAASRFRNSGSRIMPMLELRLLGLRSAQGLMAYYIIRLLE